MKLLALDSAFAAVSACVWIDGRIAASKHRALTHGHAEALLPLIETTLADAGLRALDLTRIAVTLGPGHFTGLRAGLAAAQGLIVATGAEAVGLECFAVVAASMPEPHAGERRLIAFDSKRDEAFVRLDEEAPFAASPATFDAAGDSFLVGGDLAASFAARLRDLGKKVRVADTPALPRADLLAPLAVRASPVAKLLPLYIHPPAITQAKPK
ncbi:MAG: tRNA (adenosine(37)-N6)-threonylcarbamoyltransferase complex dimerization subunit type 1 TsaB [Tagaea sp.]